LAANSIIFIGGGAGVFIIEVEKTGTTGFGATGEIAKNVVSETGDGVLIVQISIPSRDRDFPAIWISIELNYGKR
jgi:hypothetical protein